MTTGLYLCKKLIQIEREIAPNEDHSKLELSKYLDKFMEYLIKHSIYCRKIRRKVYRRRKLIGGNLNPPVTINRTSLDSFGL